MMHHAALLPGPTARALSASGGDALSAGQLLPDQSEQEGIRTFRSHGARERADPQSEQEGIRTFRSHGARERADPQSEQVAPRHF
jgi:hypothetical protein